MSTGISIAIPLGFLLLGATLCWYLAYAKGRWPLKIFLTVILALFSLETWRALDSYAGWPAKETMPQRSLLLHAVVREPHPAKNDRGAIFLWIVPLGQDDPDLFSYRPVSGEPRAYKLPYSRPMHEQTAGAMKAMQQNGRPILIERGGIPGGGESGGNRTTYGDDEGGGFRMRQLPPPSLPDKAPQGH
ncbi:MAG: hypothetical protein AAB554_02535 [Patescibacteria group bacterium]